MFGASSGSRWGASGQIIVESCSRGAATPAMGSGGNGSTDPSAGTPWAWTAVDSIVVQKSTRTLSRIAISYCPSPISLGGYARNVAA